MDESSRSTKTKENWAKARRGGEEREVFYEGDDRLPPGTTPCGNLAGTGPWSETGYSAVGMGTDDRRRGHDSSNLDVGPISLRNLSLKTSPTSIV